MFATVYVYIVSFYFYFYPDPDLCHLPYLISDDDPQSLCKGCDQGTSSRLNLSVFCRTIHILIFMLFHRVNVYRVTNVKCQSCQSSLSSSESAHRSRAKLRLTSDHVNLRSLSSDCQMTLIIESLRSVLVAIGGRLDVVLIDTVTDCH